MGVREIIDAYGFNDIQIVVENNYEITLRDSSGNKANIRRSGLQDNWHAFSFYAGQGSGFAQKFYLVVNTWAALNGQKMGAAGLSTTNQVRRTDSLISTFLRTGTTQFFRTPDVGQRFVEWHTTGRWSGNGRLSKTDAMNIYEAFTGLNRHAYTRARSLSEYNYDFSTNTFYHNNTAMTEAEFINAMENVSNNLSPATGFTKTLLTRMVMFRGIMDAVENNRGHEVEAVGKLIAKYNIPMFDVVAHPDMSVLYSLEATQPTKDRMAQPKRSKNQKVTERTQKLKKSILKKMNVKEKTGDIEEVTVTDPKVKALMSSVKKQFGKEIVFVDFPQDFPVTINGITTDKNTMYINFYSTKHMNRIVGHELFHQIKQENPELFKKLKKSMSGILTSDAIKNYLDTRPTAETEADAIFEELMADAFGDRLADTSFFEQLHKKNSTVFAEIINKLKTILRKMMQSGRFLSKESLYFNDVRKAYDIIDEMAKSYTMQKEVNVKKDNRNVGLTEAETISVGGYLVNMLDAKTKGNNPIKTAEQAKQYYKEKRKLDNLLSKNKYSRGATDFAARYVAYEGNLEKVVGKKNASLYESVGQYSRPQSKRPAGKQSSDTFESQKRKISEQLHEDTDQYLNIAKKGIDNKELRNLAEEIIQANDSIEYQAALHQALERLDNIDYKKYHKLITKMDETISNHIDALISNDYENTQGILSPLPKTKEYGSELKFSVSNYSNIEEAFRQNYGLPVRTTLQKFKELIKSIYDNRKHFQHIDYKQNGDIANELRLLEDAPERGRIKAINIIHSITKELGKNESEAFHWYVFLKDIEESYENGLYTANQIPFYDKEFDNPYEAFKKDLDKLEKELYTKKSSTKYDTAKVRDAVKKRRDAVVALRDQLIARGLLDVSVAQNDFYFRHQVLAHYEDSYIGLSQNQGDVRVRKKGFQKERTSQTEKLYNTNYFESEFEWMAQAFSQLETNDVLNKIEDLDMSDQLKQEAKEESTEDNKVNWRDKIPEGYVEWRPQDMNIFYPTMTVTEKQITQLLEGVIDKNDLPTGYAIGRKPDGLVIPEGVATTLDNFRNFSSGNKASNISRYAMGKWKQWILLNPYRYFKYNLNNLTGDMDIVLAYNPKIFKKAPRAAKELYNFYMKQEATPEMREALDESILTSNMAINEMPDLTTLGYFDKMALYQTDPATVFGKVGKSAKHMAEKFWRTSKGTTVFRENVLRYASYLHFKEELAKGKNVYAATKKYKIDQIHDNKRKAGMLSRELMIDYGDISGIGQALRTHVIPFWSWLEKNAPRYPRLLINTVHEGSSKKAMGSRMFLLGLKQSGIGATKLAIKANIIYGAINIWNASVFGDEDDELRKTARDQLYVIIGHKKENGHIPTLRMEGALSDALGWIAMEDYIADIADVVKGRRSIEDKARDAYKGVLKRFANGFHPVYKTLIEMKTGMAFYPDVFNPRPIKDNVEHATRLVSLNAIYSAATGKPSRGLGNSIFNVFGYSIDIDESYYYKTREIVNKFLEDELDKPQGFYGYTEKSADANYLRTALRYGDDKALKKYTKELVGHYDNIGKALQGIARGVKNYHPLNSLTNAEKVKFYNWLHPEDKKIVEKGVQWYNDLLQIYYKKYPEIVETAQSR